MIHQIKALRVSFEISANGARGESIMNSNCGTPYHGNWLHIAYPYEAWGTCMSPDLFLFPCDLTDEEACSLARAALRRALLALETNAQHTAEAMNESEEYGADVEWASNERCQTNDDPCHIIYYHTFYSDQEDDDPVHDAQAYITVKCSPRCAEWIEGI